MVIVFRNYNNNNITIITTIFAAVYYTEFAHYLLHVFRPRIIAHSDSFQNISGRHRNREQMWARVNLRENTSIQHNINPWQHPSSIMAFIHSCFRRISTFATFGPAASTPSPAPPPLSLAPFPVSSPFPLPLPLAASSNNNKGDNMWSICQAANGPRREFDPFVWYWIPYCVCFPMFVWRASRGLYFNSFIARDVRARPGFDGFHIPSFFLLLFSTGERHLRGEGGRGGEEGKGKFSKLLQNIATLLVPDFCGSKRREWFACWIYMRRGW